MRSAAIILSDDGCVALIERVRGSRTYYVFPGGGVDTGEEPVEAMVREVFEELGLRVEPERLVAEVQAGDELQLYYLARIVGGEFGTGTGPEMGKGSTSPEGTYKPVWLPLRQLKQVDGWPRQLLDVTGDVPQKGWPRGLLRITEVPTSPDAGFVRAA
jgi:8-oxo-dGTP pyrophosphatase MutT (NUDIX family)